MKQYLGKFATVGMALALVVCLAGSASAASVCSGNCGQSGANGVVGLSPFGSTQYQWVSTENGLSGVGILPATVSGSGSPTNGSTFSTNVFSANAGDPLDFYFNYVTSDGSGFPDYGWAALMNENGTLSAILFTARTVPAPGNIVPGVGMPAPAATLVPPVVSIVLGTDWAPLGGSSGSCWASGCGHSGWVEATYSIPNAGNYFLKIGVVNYNDTAYQSGLAMDGVTVNNVPIPTTPEPGTLVLLCGGFLPFVGRLLRRR